MERSKYGKYAQDISGARIGELEVRKLENPKVKKKNQQRYQCQCKCGKMKSFYRDRLLASNSLVSCGCKGKRGRGTFIFLDRNPAFTFRFNRDEAAVVLLPDNWNLIKKFAENSSAPSLKPFIVAYKYKCLLLPCGDAPVFIPYRFAKKILGMKSELMEFIKPVIKTIEAPTE